MKFEQISQANGERDYIQTISRTCLLQVSSRGLKGHAWGPQLFQSAAFLADWYGYAWQLNCHRYDQYHRV